MLSSVFSKFEESTHVTVLSHEVFILRYTINHRGEIVFISSFLYFYIFLFVSCVSCNRGKKNSSTEHSKGNKTVLVKVATACTTNHFHTAHFTLPSTLLYSHQHTDHHKPFPHCTLHLTQRWKRDTMRLHRTDFFPDMSNANTNITAEAKLISPHMFFVSLPRAAAPFFFILGHACFLIFTCEMRVAYLLSFTLHSMLYFHNKIPV